MPTKPQSNLPPQAQPWGRYVEESLANLERGTSINGQNSNNNLRQLNSSIQLMAEQVNFLSTQSAMDVKFTTFSETRNDGADILYPFDPTYDASISLITTISGKVLATVSAVIGLLNSTGGSYGAVYVEALWDGGGTGLQIALLKSASGGTDSGLSYSHPFFNLPTNTEITIRTRRWIRCSTFSSFSPRIDIKNQSLTTMKIKQ